MVHITLENYMENGRDNAIAVSFGEIRVYFSYRTPIAYSDGNTFFARVNRWGNTTGRHLNTIEQLHGAEKKDRLPGREFEAKLEEIFKPLGISMGLGDTLFSH